MKKFLVSLVLVFSIFFSFANLETNANITKNQEVKIDNFLKNYFDKYSEKYGNEKTINLIKKFIIKINKLEESTKYSDKLELLNYIFHSCESILDKKIIEKFFNLLKNKKIDEANKLIYNETESLEQLLNIFNKLDIENFKILNFNPARETTYKLDLELKLKNSEIKKHYSLFINVGNYSDLLGKERAGLIRINSFSSNKLNNAEQYCILNGGELYKRYIDDSKIIEACHINKGPDGINCEINLFYEGKCGE